MLEEVLLDTDDITLLLELTGMISELELLAIALDTGTVILLKASLLEPTLNELLLNKILDEASLVTEELMDMLELLTAELFTLLLTILTLDNELLDLWSSSWVWLLPIQPAKAKVNIPRDDKLKTFIMFSRSWLVIILGCDGNASDK